MRLDTVAGVSEKIQGTDSALTRRQVKAYYNGATEVRCYARVKQIPRIQYKCRERSVILHGHMEEEEEEEEEELVVVVMVVEEEEEKNTEEKNNDEI
ncbi:hypothetical protein E2C01_011852 [Portunus trituberculatus]|uniref:Uncharacterized protein n=1 Tax=Portunus trituberculatus TaxID=210409 RepID=A0A5B7DCD7_PORTR|nr:hypothetical protein [Portunus trituberculatus]